MEVLLIVALIGAACLMLFMQDSDTYPPIIVVQPSGAAPSGLGWLPLMLIGLLILIALVTGR